MRELTAYEVEEVNGGWYSACASSLWVGSAIYGGFAGAMARYVSNAWTAYQIYTEFGGSRASGSASATTYGGATSASVPVGSGCVANARIGADGSQTSIVYCPE